MRHRLRPSNAPTDQLRTVVENIRRPHIGRNAEIISEASARRPALGRFSRASTVGPRGWASKPSFRARAGFDPPPRHIGGGVAGYFTSRCFESFILARGLYLAGRTHWGRRIYRF